MKKHNRIIAAVMAVCIAGSVGFMPESIIPVVSMATSAKTIDSGTLGENLTWVFDNSWTLTISGTGDMPDFFDDNDAPWYSEKAAINRVVIEDGVTSIGKCAFSNATNLKSVIISDSVTSIGNSAFSGCMDLKEIKIPDSVTSIGRGVFSGTSWLESKQEENPLVIVNNILVDGYKCFGDVIIPDSVTSIGDSAFEYCIGLTSVTIPDSVTSICKFAFKDCKNLTSIIIPDSVTSIDTYVFDGCWNLTEITIPESVTSIGLKAFYGTPWLESKRNENPFVVINNILIDGRTCSGDVVIPDGVTVINSSVFEYTGLESVTIPYSVTYINYGAFFACAGLTSVTVLNPDCKIGDIPDTFSNDLFENFSGTIYGYENSTAQAYAEKYERKFASLGEAPEENTPTGNINGDNEFNVADVVLFQKYILGGSDIKISDWKNADLNANGILDVFDLCLMKKKLIEK